MSMSKSRDLVGGRRKGPALLAACVAAAAVLSGCGSSGGHSATSAANTKSSSTTQTTPAPSSHPQFATLTVVSAARTSGGTLNQHYSCRGADVAPEIKWKLTQTAAASAKELVVFVRTIDSKLLDTNWAVAGISPKVDRLKPGRLPTGAVVARNSFGKIGYHMCPPVDAAITMAVYALPKLLPLKRGFEPETIRSDLEASGVEWGTSVMFQH